MKVAQDDGSVAADRDPVWLVIEWPAGEARPTKFALTTLPKRMSKKQIVRTLKERWRTERAYEELKGEMGLDHFEGRVFPPRRDGPVTPTRSIARPERHFEDSFATTRIAIARSRVAAASRTRASSMNFL